jgi:hypothetical protein
MAKKTTKAWVVTVSSDRSLADVTKEMAKAGFAVDQALDQIGVVTGRSDEAVAGKVRKIRGVADVSPETSIDIGPPGSDQTW